MNNEELIQKFQLFIKKNKLFDPSQKVLLAVSGGMDSMLMAWLFHSCGYTFAIAHCNFMLRAEDSMKDEDFVRQWAFAHHIPFYVKQFETSQYAKTHSISIQMAARKLRYAWFETLMNEHQYPVLSLGQHLGDSTETMLINLVRGTGIRGLHGIKVKKSQIIRPLMFLDRAKIEGFIALNKIPFREDSSNSSSYYLRNMIRHEVIPLLQKRNPSLNETFLQTSKRLKTAERFYKEKVEELKKRIISLENGNMTFSIGGLRELKEDAATLLDEWLKPFGFSYKTTEAIVENLSASPGTIYSSDSHTIQFDRGTIILYKQESASTQWFDFSKAFSMKLLNQRNMTPITDMLGPFPTTIYLDAEKLSFPLKARYWTEGDYIVPLGMKGRKKLSNLFTDLKIPLANKKRIPLVVSGNEIVWVAGLHLHDHFKCWDSTRWYLKLSYNPIIEETLN